MGKFDGRGRGRGRGGFGRGNFSRGSFRGRGGNNRDGNPPWKRSYDDRQNRPRRETPGKRVSEQEIGVTEYLSEHDGFQGIIKLRFSDFQVSEINLQGEVAQLTNLKAPEPPPEEEVLEDDDLLTLKYNTEILPTEMWNRLNNMIEEREGAEEMIEIDVTTQSKEDRTKIHECVKKAFGTAVVGTTVTVDDKKFVRFVKYKKGVRVDKRIKWIWPGEYVHFIVYKENCDTMEAAVRIVEALRTHIRPSMLGYAGTKDRRAKTSQWFSVKRIAPSKLEECVSRLRDVTLGNYSFHQEPLKLGMLKGNKFRIALRNVTAPIDEITKACTALKSNGFINYYGLQRFGTRADVPTCLIGKSLLQADYRKAVDYVLSESSGDHHHYFRRGSPEAAVAAVLRDKPNDLQSAILKIPRNTRLLYLHAYQSLIWNKCVSERLKTLGLKPSVGDLVPAGDALIIEEIEEDEPQEESTETEPQTSDSTESEPQTTDSIETPQTSTEGEPQTNETPQTKQEEKPKIPVKVLTQEDIDSGEYSIFDVIMPLPGYNVEYPPNMKEYYEKCLKEDGLTTQLRNKNKSFSLSGAYRHIIVLPSDMSWDTVKYSDPYADLIASDVDLLRGKQLNGILPDGKYSSLLVSFSLPVSSYATMALRELLRADTSAASQAARNHYHDPPHKRPRTD